MQSFSDLTRLVARASFSLRACYEHYQQKISTSNPSCLQTRSACFLAPLASDFQGNSFFQDNVSIRILDWILERTKLINRSSFYQVYQPCVLIAKKRYVGYMYESLNQKEPEFDAKGIETVRRDNCPALGKVCVCGVLGFSSVHK